jgi:hypothetical protein
MCIIGEICSPGYIDTTLLALNLWLFEIIDKRGK